MELQQPMKILLADDHVLIRHGIKNLLSQAEMCTVVGEASNGQQLLSILQEQEADLVILDISMPEIGGLEAITMIRERFPEVKILIFTMHKSKQYFYHAMMAGADGYLVKDDSEDDLLKAISRIAHGKTYISPFLAEDFADDVITIYRREKKSPFQELTKREREILQLVVDGNTSRQIADKLQLSPRTIDHHRSNLLRKFNMKNSVDLVNYAVQNGFASPVKY